MADCPFGSRPQEGVPPTSFVTIRVADFRARTPQQLLDDSIVFDRARGEYGVELDELLAPENISEYGVVYRDLVSNFCSSVPPTSFPGYDAGTSALAAAVARQRWNELCRCSPQEQPPGKNCFLFPPTSPLYGKGQCPGNYEVDVRVTTRTNSRVVTFVVPGYIRGIERDTNGYGNGRTQVSLFLAHGTQNAPGTPRRTTLVSADSEENPGSVIVDIRPRFNTFVDNCCAGAGTEPPPPNYNPNYPQGALVSGYPPGQSVPDEEDIVIIYLPGAPGPKGDKGDKGDDGARGLDGSDGAAGRDGVDGLDGRPGRDGDPGRDGSAGLPGRDGADGADGRDGEDGEAATFSLREVRRVALSESARVIESGTPQARIYDLELPESVEIISADVSVPFCENGSVISEAVEIGGIINTLTGNQIPVLNLLFTTLGSILEEICDDDFFDFLGSAEVSGTTSIPVTENATRCVIQFANVPVEFGRRFSDIDNVDKFDLGGVSFRVQGGFTVEHPIQWRRSVFDIPLGSNEVRVWLYTGLQGTIQIYGKPEE